MVLDLAQRNEINLIISFKVKNFLYKYLCRNFSDEYIDIKFHVSIFLLSYLLQTKTPPKTKSWLRPWFRRINSQYNICAEVCISQLTQF